MAMSLFETATIIERFKNSGWTEKAQACLKTPEQLKNLLENLSGYINKDGLKDVRDKLVQLSDFLKLILTGKYHDYKDNTLILIVAVVIYVVSPIDLIPDFLPGGLVDDGAIVTWLFQTLGDKLKKWSDEVEQGKSENP